MTPNLSALQIFLAGPIDCSTPELHQLADKLFEQGWLNVNPPGWRFAINDAGRAALATYVPPVAEPALTDRQGHIIAAALELGFEITNEGADEYVCTEEQLLAFAEAMLGVRVSAAPAATEAAA